MRKIPVGITIHQEVIDRIKKVAGPRGMNAFVETAAVAYLDKVEPCIVCV